MFNRSIFWSVLGLTFSFLSKYCYQIGSLQFYIFVTRPIKGRDITQHRDFLGVSIRYCQDISFNRPVMTAGWTAGGGALIPSSDKWLFSSLPHRNSLWGPPSLLCNGYQWRFFTHFHLTTHLHLVSRPRTSRPMPPLSRTSSWWGD
jgi:hypothetical protein